MKLINIKHICFIILLVIPFHANSQIICIRCFNQTNPISPAAVNSILNGSFENTNCIPSDLSSQWCPNSLSYSCNIQNWTGTGGGTNTYAIILDVAYSVIANGTNAVYFGNFFCSACSTIPNDTICLVNNGCEITGVPAGYPNNSNIGYGGTAGLSLSQTINGLIPGNIYILEFWVGGEDIGQGSGMFGLDIGFGYTMLTNSPTKAASGATGKRYIVEFKATSSTHTIKFTNWGHICNDCTELVLDDVRLYPISELSPAFVPCPSTDSLQYTQTDTTICMGEKIIMNGKIYTASGAYVDSIIYSETSKHYFKLKLNVTECLNISFPNAFSPNGDNSNDEFKIITSEFNLVDFKMIIFNRWGEQVFSSTNPQKGWNGTFRNSTCEIGVYFYLVTFKTITSSKTYQYKGDVSLLR
mgnify:CR=1 FL=1